jgi:glutathione S-transferase
MPLTLYYHPLASYCHKVLIALYENEIAFEGRIIDLGDAGDRSELQALWPFCKFPVIRDHQRKRDVPESSVIIEYLNEYYLNKNKMIPADVDAALQVRLWDRILDNYVHGPMQDIVNDHLCGAHGDLTAARNTLSTAYSTLDKQVQLNPWVAGDTFALADCAAAPALFYASTVAPFPKTHSHLNAYFERLVDRPSVRRVLDEAKPYFHYYPFNSAIAAQFR